MALKRVKKVEFALEERSVYIYGARPDDILWVTTEESRQSKENMKKDGRRIRHDGHDKLLEGTFKSARDDVQKSLNEYARFSGTRGVERHVCRSHFEERRSQRRRAIQGVLLVQEKSRTYNLSVDETWESMREISLRLCCDSKVFARRMGKADEAACYPKNKRRDSLSSNKNSQHHRCSSICRNKKSCVMDVTNNVNSKAYSGRAAIKV